MLTRLKINGKYTVVPVVDCPFEMIRAGLDGVLTYLPFNVGGENCSIAVKIVHDEIICIFANKED